MFEVPKVPVESVVSWFLTAYLSTSSSRLLTVAMYPVLLPAPINIFNLIAKSPLLSLMVPSLLSTLIDASSQSIWKDA